MSDSWDENSDINYVYIIGHVDPSGEFRSPVKIGITRSLGSRLNTLKTANPYPLRLLHSIAVPNRDAAVQIEAEFHRLHAPCRMSGEWFDMEPIGALRNLILIFEILLRANGATGGEVTKALRFSGISWGAVA